VRSLIATFLAVLLCACPQQPQGTAGVSISAHPSRIDDMGESTTLDISAVDALGNPGTGTVTLSSAAGTLMDMSVKLDASGSATSKFSCNVTSDANCKGRVGVTASWNSQTATTHVQVGDAGLIGMGGGSAAGGGTAAGGGMGGGGPDSGMGGGGSEPDGGPDSGVGGGSGTADGGMDGGVIDAGPPAAVDAGSVLILGSLTPAMGQWALAGFATPKDPVVGLPVSAQIPSAQLNGAGQLVYYDELLQQVSIMVPDPYDMNGTGSAYPSASADNDLAVDTPACDGGPVLGFWTRPDRQSVVYRCVGDGGYFEGTKRLTGLGGFIVVAAGHGDSLLIVDPVLGTGYTADDGGHHPVLIPETMLSLTQGFRGREVRAVDGGYWVMRGSMNDEVNGPCNLYFVDKLGNVAYVDQFTGRNIGTAPLSCTGRIDEHGALYTPVMLGSDWGILRRPQFFDGDPTTLVYSTMDAGMSSFATYPPRVFTFFDGNSTLVTGP
jgi:hypothetical protein